MGSVKVYHELFAYIKCVLHDKEIEFDIVRLLYINSSSFFFLFQTKGYAEVIRIHQLDILFVIFVIEVHYSW